jgi:hypothetical protein
MAGVAGNQFMARTGAQISIGQAIDLPSPTPACGDSSYSMEKRFGREDLEESIF